MYTIVVTYTLPLPPEWSSINDTLMTFVVAM